MGVNIGVSKNRGGPPKSSILIGFSIKKPSILGGFPPIFGCPLNLGDLLWDAAQGKVKRGLATKQVLRGSAP